MVFQNNVLAGASNVTGEDIPDQYLINQSIRFNDGDSAFMKRDYSGDGSQTTFTLSGWFKLGDLSGTAHCLFATGFINGSAADFTLYFSGDQLYLYAGYNGGTPANKLETTQLFRDFASWYHIVFEADTTNVVSTERLRLYVNGSRVTDFDGTPSYPNQNDTLVWGDATYSHVIGATGDDVAGNLNSQTPRYHYDGYMAELVYIDGTALDPSSFGEYNSKGIWIPKNVSGLTFGTNGFHIDGRDATGTPVKLGDDEAGSNNYTTSGMEANDQVSDSPTNNICVLNSLDNRGSGSLSQGNLRYAGAATNDNVTGTIGLNSGKWYWEVFIEDEDYAYLGIQKGGISATGYAKEAVTLVTGDTAGTIHENNVNTGKDSFIANTNDVVGVAVDIDNKKIWWSKNGQWYRADQASTATINISEVESGNQGFAFSLTSDTGFFVPYIGNYTHATTIINFGQEGTFADNKTAGNNSDGNGLGNFFSTVPSGFLAINTKNLGES